MEDYPNEGALRGGLGAHPIEVSLRSSLDPASPWPGIFNPARPLPQSWWKVSLGSYLRLASVAAKPHGILLRRQFFDAQPIMSPRNQGSQTCMG